MPLFRGTFFLKNVESSISVFEICCELWAPFEGTYRIMGTILGKILQTYKEGDLALTKRISR